MTRIPKVPVGSENWTLQEALDHAGPLPDDLATACALASEDALKRIWDAPTLAAWNALLDSFDAGDAQDHRDTVATLAQALNEDRPGQRRVFGEGINPSVEQPS